MQENVMSNSVNLNEQQSAQKTKVKKPMSKNKKQCLIAIAILSVLSIILWYVQVFVIGVDESLGEVVGSEVFPETVMTLTIGSFTWEISNAVVSVWITVGILILFAVIFRYVIFPKFKTVPGGFQSFMEWIVCSFDNMAKENVHGLSPFMGPVAFATAAFICIGTLTETLGIRPPNTDINVCLALALITFVLIHVIGVIKKGLGKRLKRYVTVIPLLTDIAVPVSMTFRMYGSILSGFLMMALIFNALSAVIPAFCYMLFTLFHALIQSYVFAVLTLSFVSEAIE